MEIFGVNVLIFSISPFKIPEKTFPRPSRFSADSANLFVVEKFSKTYRAISLLNSENPENPRLLTNRVTVASDWLSLRSEMSLREGLR